MQILTIGEIEQISHALARKLLRWDEPIPPFQTRLPNILESCLATPFQSFNGKDLYPGLVKKASVLFYLLIKNHPFKNGNKRIAMTTMLIFFLKNGKWVKVDNQRLYIFTIWIAESDARLKGPVVSAIETFLNMYLIDAE